MPAHARNRRDAGIDPLAGTRGARATNRLETRHRMESFTQPTAVVVWVLLTACLLVPVGIAVTVFPELIKL